MRAKQGLRALLERGKPRRDDGTRGYRLVSKAIARQHLIEPGDTYLVLQVAVCARLFLAFQAASERLDQAQEARRQRRGRYPTAGGLSALERQVLATSGAYQQATEALRVLADRDPDVQDRRARAQTQRLRGARR
jgi:hypothetical protein